MEFITGFESSRFMPPYRSDVLETSNHIRLFRDDLRLVRDAGISTLRYAVPWHRIEKKRGRFDWRWMDEVMEAMAAQELDPILDLVHHISIPSWMKQGFAHPDYPQLQAAFAAEVTERYPHVTKYTPFNEPMGTVWLAGKAGVWYPFGKNDRTFVAMLLSVAKAICLTCQVLTEHNAGVEIIHLDTAEAHQAIGEPADHVQRYVERCNQRRFICDDLILGQVGEKHPLFSYMREHGYTDEDETWFATNRAKMPVRGLDYYPHSERDYFVGGSQAPSLTPRGFANIVEEYRAHFEQMEGVECPAFWLTETNVRGFHTDRLSWLKYMVEQCEKARIPVFGWFPFIDSTGWGETLLRIPHTRIDPVGIYYLDEQRERRHDSELSSVYGQLARGEIDAVRIPAYEFQMPLDEELGGYRPQVDHWSWCSAGFEQAS